MSKDQPSATVEFEREGAAIVAPPARVHAVIGCCTTGDSLDPYAFYNAETLADERGAGPMVKAGAYSLARSGASLIATRVPATARAAYVSPLDLDDVTGTADPTVSGTPTDGYDVVITVTSGGTIGTDDIDFTVSTDGGTTTGAEQTMLAAGPYNVGIGGTTLTFTATETLATNDEIRFYTLPASASILTQSLTRAAADVTSTATAVLSGTPVDAYEVWCQVVTGGTLGTKGISVRYSLDGGRKIVGTFQLGTAKSIELMDGDVSSGLTLTFVDVPAVAATGSITAVGGASLVDGQTFTIDDGANAPTVFEFDSNASVSPGNVAVTFTGGDSAGTVRDAIIAAINGVGAGLAVTAAIGGAAVVDLENDTAGADGNATITETVVNAGFVVSGMAGGADITAGTLNAGDLFEADTTAPEPAVADILTAIERLDESQHAWSYLHIVGEMRRSDANSIAAALADLATSTNGDERYVVACLSARDRSAGEDDTAWSARLVDDFGTLESDRLSIGAGMARVQCPITARRNRRPAQWIHVARINSGIKLEEDAAKRALGPLFTDVSLYNDDNLREEHDSRINGLLHAQRFVTLGTRKNRGGVYVTEGSVFAPQGALVERFTERRVVDLVAEVGRQAAEEFLQGEYLPAEDGSGRLSDGDAADLEAYVLSEILGQIGTAIAGCTVLVDRNAPVLTTGELPIRVKVRKLIYIRKVRLKVGVERPTTTTSGAAA